MAHKFVYITFPDNEQARTMAHDLLQQKLVACVNVLPHMTSIYSWNGKVQEETETAMVCKTVANKIEPLKTYIAKHHPYDTPCVVAWDITDGAEPFLEWVKEATQ